MTKIVELFGESTSDKTKNWKSIVDAKWCPFHDRTCVKIRKSDPTILIGSCTVSHGRSAMPVIICPQRLLARRQIFIDTFHLLTLHEPGNELHIVPEISIPGGSVDYFVVSVSQGRIRDFVGIELQSVDSTGTVWPERQRFLASVGVPIDPVDAACRDGFGMNWKMSAKTILMQLHHKVETFEHLNKKFVLVIQDHLFDYMYKNFSFDHLSEPPRKGDSMHFHAYRLQQESNRDWRLNLSRRVSTDTAGLRMAIGLQADPRVGLEIIIKQIESKMSELTRFEVGGPLTDASPKSSPS